MTSWQVYRKSIFILLVFLIALGGAACVELDVDPGPPYPARDRDYTYPDEEDLPAPWVDPENYPYVTIVSPADGAIIDAASVDVAGTYAGPELDSLTINGQDISLSGNSFTARIDINDDAVVVPIMVEAITAERGRTSAARVTVFHGVAADANSTAPASLALDLENRGLAAVGETLASLIDGLDLADLLNPKIAAEGKAGIEVKTALIEGVDLILRSTEEGLVVKIVVGNIEVDIDVDDSPVLQLRVEGLIIDMLAEIVTNEDGQLKIVVIDSDVSLASLGMDNDLLDEIASYVVSLVLDLLIDSLVPGLLEDLLAGLQFDIAGNGYALTLAAAGAVTTDRNLALAMSSTLAVTDPDFWTPGFLDGGYLSTPSAPAAFPAVTPTTHVPYGIALGVNDDFVNQLLYAVAGTGTMELVVEEEFITSQIASLLFFSFENIDPAKPLLLRLRPSVAPIAAGNADTNLMSLILPAYTGQVLIDCDGDAECLAHADEDGLWEAMSFTVDLHAPLALTFHDNASFSLQLGDLSIIVDVVHNAVGQNNVDNMERLFAEIFGDLLPELLGGLEDMTITLPELLDLDLVIADLATFGARDDNLGIFIDLQ